MKLSKKVLLAIVVVAVIIAFAYMVMPVNRLQQKIASDIAKVNARFNPSNSIDLLMANKSVTHESPVMLNPPVEVPPLLLYPPSAEDLAKLSGE
jgi:predicted Holliday junction resolvase-like endonuclease